MALANDTISETEEALIARLCNALEVPLSDERKLRLELTELVYQDAPAVPVVG